MCGGAGTIAAMATPERLILVDGSSLIYRAFFAIPGNLSTAFGLHTNAIYGFATMFRKMLAGRRPERGAVVFDAPGKTFRDERYADYKSQRPSMASELREQLGWIDRVVEAHRFQHFRVQGYEADDVIGTLTQQAVEAGMEVVIVSGDKDFAQLISDRVKMVDTLRDVTFDPELVRKKWGVRPEQMVDFLALMGDKVDNVPGVAGIGQKGAAKLLETYGTLDAILEHKDELKGRQGTALEEHADDARLSRELVTLDRAVPLELSLDDLRLEVPDPVAINELYRELEFYSLLGDESADAVEVDDDAEYQVLSGAEARAAVAELPSGAALLPIVDLPRSVDGKVTGFAFAPHPGVAFYVAVASLDDARALLEPLTVDADRRTVVYDAKQVWVVLDRCGLELAGRLDDVHLASYLVEPTKVIPHRLDQIVKEYLHRTIPPAKRILGSGKSVRRFSELEAAELGPYACQMADVLAQLWPILAGKLVEEEQERYLAEVELPLARVLARMERDGILVDGPDLARIGREFGERLAGYERRIHELAGREFNIGSTKQLSQVLFEELKLPVIKRTKSGYSTNAEVLERLAPKHEIAREILEHRKLAKLINTYTDVLTREVNPVTGRIHASFQQTTAATGRLITTIELRLLAHFTRDPVLVEAFRDKVDVHRRTASQLFGCAADAVTAEQRGVGKLVNFATIYGQGATALSQTLGVPRKEAQRYIDDYFAAMSGVRAWLDGTIEQAHRDGFVTTVLGRRRWIPELSSRNFQERQAGERIAANTPIQGSAADLCKVAMLRIAAAIEREGLEARMLLQVHDELVFELPTDEVDRLAAIVREHMENVHPLEVPLIVDIGTGASWADAK